MAGFLNRLDELNALAEKSPGFVWRLQTGEGNATYFRPYADDRILMNMSVWATIEALRDYVYTPPMRNCCGRGRNGSRSFLVRTAPCGGCRRAIFPALMKPGSVLLILMYTGPLSLRLTLKRHFSPTRTFSGQSIGRSLSLVRPFR